MNTPNGFQAALRAPQAWALGLLLAATSLPALAQQLIRDEIRNRSGYTQGQWALLPEWCIDSQDGPYGSPEGAAWLNKSPRAPHWVTLMGHDFWAMHHYCRGLRQELLLNSLGAVTPRERAAMIENALDEYRYIFRNTKPTMPLLPEVYLKAGEMHLLRNDLPAAQQHFEMARQLKKDYWPAYTRWVDVLIGLKQTDRARELVAEGLAHMPGEPNLLERQRKLGGPGPARPARPAAVAAAAAPAASAPP
jgi:tetratricopeptide (TPR) repeat protein